LSGLCERPTKKINSDSCSDKMTQTVTIRVEKPVTSATLLDEAGQEAPTTPPEAAGLQETEKENLATVCRALQEAVNKINRSQENIFDGYKGQIVKLSVEIARKILAQKIAKGDYEIESIIQEALKNAPTRQQVVVRLNPDDLAQLRKARQGGTAGDIEFVADVSIGRAQCVVETPKGIIESLIDEHLEQIGEMLKKVE